MGTMMLDKTKAMGASASTNGEFGWSGLASTWFTVDPENEIGILLLTQLIPSYELPTKQQFRYLAFSSAKEYLDQKGE